MRHISERIQIALVAVGVLAVSAFWAYLLTTTPEPEPFPAPSSGSSTQAGLGHRVTFVGDAFTAPTPSGGNGPNAYPALIANRFGWQQTTLANDGIGYVARGQMGLTLAGLTGPIVDSRPDLLVVFAGRADAASADARAVGPAAREFYDGLRRQLPDTRIVVVGPIATDATPPSGAAGVRDALAAEVQRTPNASFVDPLAEKWFADAPAGSIAADGQHPTDVGHRVIAEKLSADLLALGVAPQTSSS